jgi:integrase
LRWRDVDFPRSVIRVRASYAAGEVSVPKSGKVRSVPMVDEVAVQLARLSEHPEMTGDDDLVFAEAWGDWLDDDRLRRRYNEAIRAAGLRRLRFHDLRHTFGSLAITTADIVEVQAWMGHADIQTTMRYLHYRDRGQAAERLGEAFRVQAPGRRSPAGPDATTAGGGSAASDRRRLRGVGQVERLDPGRARSWA